MKGYIKPIVKLSVVFIAIGFLLTVYVFGTISYRIKGTFLILSFCGLVCCPEILARTRKSYSIVTITIIAYLFLAGVVWAIANKFP